MNKMRQIHDDEELKYMWNKFYNIFARWTRRIAFLFFSNELTLLCI